MKCSRARWPSKVDTRRSSTSRSSRPPPPPHQLNPAIPQVLDQLVMRMIAKNPTERPTLDEVFESLRRKDLEGIS